MGACVSRPSGRAKLEQALYTLKKRRNAMSGDKIGCIFCAVLMRMEWKKQEDLKKMDPAEKKVYRPRTTLDEKGRRVISDIHALAELASVFKDKTVVIEEDTVNAAAHFFMHRAGELNECIKVCDAVIARMERFAQYVPRFGHSEEDYEREYAACSAAFSRDMPRVVYSRDLPETRAQL